MCFVYLPQVLKSLYKYELKLFRSLPSMKEKAISMKKFVSTNPARENYVGITSVSDELGLYLFLYYKLYNNFC